MNIDNLQLDTPYLQLDEEFYQIKPPTPLNAPYLISFNPLCAKLIGLKEELKEDKRLIELLNGEYTPQGSMHFSMCYAGHQFGHYNHWLGDGRASNLGKTEGYNLQLKGSGETLYSRTADGRATIASSLREYLMSEAMYHLGIPTTRALGVIGSKNKLIRNGVHNAAMLMRLSTSWVRFGTFEYFHYSKEYEKLKSLTEYVIAESYPHLTDDEDRYYKMFCEVVERTAFLIAKWQGVGFCHGVMNTDNMSIAGLTIDYGPYSMLDDFNYSHVCNSTDKVGRYSYGDQPNISYWNLTKLSEALTSLIDTKRMEQKLDEFGASIYPNAYIGEMRRKLGLKNERNNDIELIRELVGALQDATVDHTLFFRTLSKYDGDRAPLYDIVMDPIVIDAWLKLYDERLVHEEQDQSKRQEEMLKANPKYVLKNYMLQNAITLAQNGDYSMVETLMYIATHPYDELPEYEHLSGDTPEEYKNTPLSCSS